MIHVNSNKSNRSINKSNNHDSDSSGNNVKISVNTQKQKQQSFRSGGTTIKVNGMSSSSSPSSMLKTNKISNSSIIFLGDCEMPITKSGSLSAPAAVIENKNSGSDSSANKTADISKFTQKIQITGSVGVGDELKQQFAASSEQTR